jgi:hypothetical protein
MAADVSRGAGTEAGAPGTPPSARKSWTAGRVVVLVAGSILILACVALLGGAGVLTWADRPGGYLTTGTATYSTSGYALASDPVRLHGLWGWLGRWAGDVRIQVTASEGTPVFVAIGPAGAVSRYLAGTSYTSVTTVGDQDLMQHPGSAVPAPPSTAVDWAARVSGTGTQTLRWTVRSGDWTVVVMNPDGSPGVTVRADVGVSSPVLSSLAGDLLLAGLTAGLIGGALAVISVRLAAGRSGVTPP